MPESLSPEAEQTAIIQVQRGQREAFRPLYRHYLPRVYAYVAYRVASREDAEDLTADIFLNVLRALEGFNYRGRGSFAAYLFRSAHNAVQQHYREQQRNPQALVLDALPEIASTEVNPDDALQRQEAYAHLRACIDTLPARRQEIVRLRFFAGLRNQEIAEVLHLNEKTVASHLSRALDDLRRLYHTVTITSEESH